MPINLDELLWHDVGRVFGVDDNNSIVRILDLISQHSDRILEVYEHTVSAQPTWIAERWRRAVNVGYLTQTALDQNVRERSEWLAGAESEVAPLSIKSGNDDTAVRRQQYLYLFSLPNWNLSRGTFVPQQLAGAVEDGRDGLQINKNKLNAIFQQISGLGNDNGGNAANLDAAAKNIFNQNGGQFGKVSSVLLHLVWPHVFPVWFITTGDGYSQVRGMRRILRDLSEKIGQRPVANFEINYENYASAYRIILKMYRLWLQKQNLQPTHFDFLTEMLANLEPRAVSGQLLETKKALILYGVPGTGKTQKALELARDRVGEGPDCITRVQFHPGYSYADFVIGIRPVVIGGAVTYEARQGVLYECAEQAAVNPNQNFCLVIDEINRANLSEVLGEVMYCLEYRGEENHIRLPQRLANLGDNDPFEGGHKFYIPGNLYIIGTMNHADRSISGFDMALRRRFAWYKMEPMTWVGRELASKHFDPASREAFLEAAHDLNACISEGRVALGNDAARIPLNEDHQIGDSYFAAITAVVEEDANGDAGQNQPRHILPQHREKLWLYFIEPLLEDFLGSDAHAYRESLAKLGQRFIGRD